jgi:hypothetical protein
MHSGAIKNNNLYLEGFMKRINMSLLALLLATGAPIGAMDANKETINQKPMTIDWQYLINKLQEVDVGIAERLQKPSKKESLMYIGLLGTAGITAGFLLGQGIGCSLPLSSVIGSVIGGGIGYTVNEKLDQYNAIQQTKKIDAAVVNLHNAYLKRCTMRLAQINPVQTDFCIKLYDVLKKYDSHPASQFKEVDAFWRNQKQ